jgi:bifunctional DNA-binding transcriptional regulator/antitoxin component of YhaV-PrlF toxin-antitoxin module
MEGSRVTIVTFDGREIAIPAETIAQAGIREGDELLIEPIDGGVVVRRRRSRNEIDEEIAAGRTERFESDEPFAAQLERDPKPLDE